MWRFLLFKFAFSSSDFCAENNKSLNGHFAHCICQKFYHCDVLEKTVVKDCAPGTVWDDEIKTCNFPAANLMKNCCDLRVKKCGEICENNATTTAVHLTAVNTTLPILTTQSPTVTTINSQLPELADLLLESIILQFCLFIWSVLRSILC